MRFACIVFQKEKSMIAQQYRRIPFPLIGAALFGLLVGVYLFAWKRKRSEKRKSATVIGHRVEKHPDDVLKHWTAEKMRDAKPAPLPKVDALERGKEDVQSPSDK